MSKALGHYDLVRDDMESERLNNQHRLYTEVLGYTVHPSIIEKLPSEARIADLGTGTGAFLLDVASELGDAVQLDGFDLSDAQFPPPSSLPENVKLRVANIKQPFPQSLHGVYDVVCLRLLVGAMEKHEWEPVTQNIMTLLKPGGAIQWTESDHVDLFARVTGSSSTSRTDRLRFWTEKVLNDLVGEQSKYGWSTLPGIFKDQGLENVMDVVYDTDKPEFRDRMTSNDIAVCRSIASVPKWIDNYGGPEGVDTFIKEMQEDQATGAYVTWDLHVAIGFKPR